MTNTYTAETLWVRNGEKFTDNRYSRRHLLRFDAGITIPGSSSPHIVPLPFSDPLAIDPEEFFVSSISSCHMLWFLSIAAKNGFVVERYLDVAIGRMTENVHGKPWISSVTLQPEILFSETNVPDRFEVEKMHHDAHEQCFIANSIKTKIDIKIP